MIIDITGVPVVDTSVASVLLQATHAVKLLGAQVILTGIRPEVAQTIVGLGIDLRGVVTYGSLQTGVATVMRHAQALSFNTTYAVGVRGRCNRPRNPPFGRSRPRMWPRPAKPPDRVSRII